MATRLVSGDALMTDEYWSITGDAGEGTLMTFSPDPRKNPVATDVVERFRNDGYEFARDRYRSCYAGAALCTTHYE